MEEGFVDRRTVDALERLRVTMEGNARTLEEIAAYEQRVRVMEEAARMDRRAAAARRAAKAGRTAGYPYD